MPATKGRVDVSRLYGPGAAAVRARCTESVHQEAQTIELGTARLPGSEDAVPHDEGAVEKLPKGESEADSGLIPEPRPEGRKAKRLRGGGSLKVTWPELSDARWATQHACTTTCLSGFPGRQADEGGIDWLLRMLHCDSVVLWELPAGLPCTA